MDWLTLTMAFYLPLMGFFLGWRMGRRPLRDRRPDAAAQGGH